MDRRASGPPVVLTEEKQAVLYEGIGLIFSRWTALQGAVEHGWGGKYSRDKAQEIVYDVLDHFTKSKDPMDLNELVKVLEAGLLELFSTVAEDGSPKEVANKLLELYKECLNGNYQFVEELRLTNSQKSAKVVKVSNGNDEEDEESDEEDDESDDQDEDTCMNDYQTTDMMVDTSDQCSNQKPEVMPVDEAQADDGWTVVPCRKNKGNMRN